MNTRDKCHQLINKYYANVPLRDRTFNEGIARHLKPDFRVLDAGCGRDAPSSVLHAARTDLCVGVDRINQFDPLSGVERVRSDLANLPFIDESFHMVFSRSVLEHLQEPRTVFLEFARVLKKGGITILSTPNKYDYASILARLIPNRMHGHLLRSAVGEEVYDDFPTYFKANTAGAVARAIAGTGLEVRNVTYIRHYPYYLMFSLPLFYLGIAYDRLITGLRLHRLQPSIYLELIKT